MTAMRCFVLPGMDGTGALLDEFVAAMAPRFDTQVIAYPRDRRLGYAELAEFVHPQLPTDRPYLLLGESFSGPVAIALAAQRPPHLAGLVLCASFARAPRPPGSPWSAAMLPRWATKLPVSRVPGWLVAQMMLGRWSDARWRARIRATLNAVQPAVLAHRLDAVRGVDATAALGEIDLPMLYLRATHDRLVGRDSQSVIQQARPQTGCIEIDAPHFVLQAAPVQAASAIQQWCDEAVESNTVSTHLP
ncbi:MAG: alpha/beta hydrolase [Lysobacter sp.]|nr:alpha/beta hydrolase [Lysobacter sp.]